MHFIPGIFRFILMWVYVACYLLQTSIGGSFIRNTVQRRRFYAQATSFWTRRGIRMLGIRVSVSGREQAAPSHALVVSNHLSYIDIFCISSIYPSLFITSVEVQRAFFLGTMSTYGGSIFVERRSKSRLHHDIEQVAAAITTGQPVVLFPEGTTGNGNGLLPFKASLFSVAENTNITTQPICIRYRRVGGKPVTEKNRDTVYYYGDIGFFPHFFGLPFRGGMDVEITFLPPIPPKADRTRKELCDLCRTEIEKVYRS